MTISYNFQGQSREERSSEHEFIVSLIPGLYYESVRRTWKLLLSQIGNGATSPLMQALARRSPVEEKIFLSIPS